MISFDGSRMKGIVTSAATNFAAVVMADAAVNADADVTADAAGYTFFS